ncbi:MAG: arginine--tRNA ligase [Acidobacteriota bacterium]|nr:arginine--tRNA ligase [Blastocatellia bacterium]MDW8412753.1 arginine--tRNA ligase [Acidobacteriota bacterium]
MLTQIQETLKTLLCSAVEKLYSITMSPTEIVTEFPPRPELGDLAIPVAFELAKRLKATTEKKVNPRQIAEALRQELGKVDGISRFEIAGGGYINAFFDRSTFVTKLNSDIAPGEKFGGKLIVEHTSVNPNKAAHIGHLRNAVLGDTIVRMLKATGEQVEVHNYIDNTGVQVADVVVGLKHIEKKSLSELESIDKFDYYCWDLYARVGRFYEEAPDNKQLRAEVLHALEHGQGEVAELADYVSTRILKCHLKTMQRLDITYDVLPRESEIIKLNFWQTAFEKLKQAGAIYYETEGRNKGCWVMRSEGNKSESEPDEKILVRSNGTVTYTGKDIAYHLWKLGLLELDFNYKVFYTYPNGKQVWITTPELTEDRPGFGKATAYFNVIDVGQSYPQHYVKLGVKLLSSNKQIDKSAHLAYEKVVLTPRSARELGYELGQEDAHRSQISMSGRKGLGVKADDLIDKLEEKALAGVTERNPELPQEKREEIAHILAVGALRYYLLKYTRSSVIAFDFDEALTFEGETGPYIQYALVRIAGIFRKMADIDVSSWLTNVSPEKLTQLLSMKEEATGWDGNYLWSLLHFAAQLNDVLRTAIRSLEPTHLAKYAYQLAARFNEFYNKSAGMPIYKVVAEPDLDKRMLLVLIVDYVRRQLTLALQLLGINVPDRM